MDNKQNRKKILIFIVAYNAEKTIEQVLARIPGEVFSHDTDILIIDDSSTDRTWEKGVKFAGSHGEIPIRVLKNPVNQGYGGNQKLGFNYAEKYGYDIVVLLHGDGQYAPEYMPGLLEPLFSGEADAVFGSRMMRPFDALKGGMPLYKFVGNILLTFLQNRLMKVRLSEWHSGYRLYSVPAFRDVPIERNDNGFAFDTDIILQFIHARRRIVERPIPTYYGEEICNVNGFLYALRILMNTVWCRLHNMNLTYVRRYDCTPDNRHYTLKMGYPSSHTLTLAEIPDGSTVLDIGCGPGLLASELRRKNCRVIGMDAHEPPDLGRFDRFIKGRFPDTGIELEPDEKVDIVLMLDVIEHAEDPEAFLDEVRRILKGRRCRVLITSPNVAFVGTRLQLLLGRFHYVKRGILDKTHFHLFTFRSLRNLLEQSGYRIEEMSGITAPFPEAIGFRPLAMLLVRINLLFVKIWKTLFAYQMFVIAEPLPTLDALLERTVNYSGGLDGGASVSKPSSEAGPVSGAALPDAATR